MSLKFCLANGFDNVHFVGIIFNSRGANFSGGGVKLLARIFKIFDCYRYELVVA